MELIQNILVTALLGIWACLRHRLLRLVGAGHQQ